MKIVFLNKQNKSFLNESQNGHKSHRKSTKCMLILFFIIYTREPCQKLYAALDQSRGCGLDREIIKKL